MALPRFFNLKICPTIRPVPLKQDRYRCRPGKTGCKKVSTLKSEFKYFHFFRTWRMIASAGGILCCTSVPSCAIAPCRRRYVLADSQCHYTNGSSRSRNGPRFGSRPAYSCWVCSELFWRRDKNLAGCVSDGGLLIFAGIVVGDRHCRIDLLLWVCHLK
jgi:hypothetical protein